MITLKNPFKTALIALAGSVFATVAAAGTPTPVLMPPFAEKPADIVAPAAAGACSIRFTALTDERHDLKTIGIAANRPVLSPDDTQAWLKGILGGLPARGITPVFDAPADAGAAADTTPAVKLKLKLVWLTPVAIDFSANVVMSIDASTTDGRTLTKSYRGQIAAMNMANGTGEMTSAINRAFGDALNKMAPDLQGLCHPA